MSHKSFPSAIRHLHTLYRVGTAGGLDDRQLLERFRTGHREAAELAFAALVERHGVMVLRVCRSVLSDSHEAQDAFQATFLVLATKAGGLWSGESLAPWLHAVALRVATKARTATARRRRAERCAAELERRADVVAPPPDLAPVLHEEIGRLPEKYRVPIILCYFEGHTHEGAAHQLGWPVGTVRGRLARARGLLKQRLARRGLGLPAGLLAAGLFSEAAAAAIAVPAALAKATIQAAAKLGADEAVVGVVSTAVVALVNGMRRALIVNRLHAAGILLAIVGVAGLEGMRFGHASAGGTERAENAPAAPAAVTGARDRARAILRQAAEAAGGIERPLDRGWTLAELGMYMARAGDAEAAAQWVRDAAGAAAESAPQNGLWSHLVWAQRVAGDLEGAWRATDVPYGFEQKLADLRKLARDQVRVGRPADALKALGRAEALLRAEPPYRHRPFNLFHIAHDRALAGDPQGALRIVDGVTFEGEWAQSNEVDAFSELFLGLVEAGDRPAAAPLLCRAFAIRDALAPGTIHYNNTSRSIAECQAKAGMLEEAIQTAQAIHGDALGLEWAEMGRGTTRIWLERGNADRAALVLEEVLRISSTIRGDGDRAETLLLIARHCLKRDDREGAQRAASAIPDSYPQKAFALTEVAIALRDAGSRDAATSILQAATTAAEAVATAAERSEALRRVAEAWAKSGGIAEANRIVEAITVPSAKAEALRQVAIAEIAEGKSAEARALLGRATELAQGIRVGTKRAEILRALGVVWAQAGDRANAGQAFRQAISAVDALPDLTARCEALGAIAGAQLAAGDRDAARSTVRQAIDAALASNDIKAKNTFLRASSISLSTLAMIQAENGDEDGALAWASTLTSPMDRSWALRGAGLGLLQRIGAWTAEDRESR